MNPLAWLRRLLSRHFKEIDIPRRSDFMSQYGDYREGLR